MNYKIQMPEKLAPIFQGRADVRAARGGRGSGKTYTFAKMSALIGMRYGQAGISGFILCAREVMNSINESSFEEVKRAIEGDEVLSAYYEIGKGYVESVDKRIRYIFAGLTRNLPSIKSKGRVLVCWVEEAESVSEDAFSILEPTLRDDGRNWNAELWLTWNPERRLAPVETRYANSADPMIKVVTINWQDNRWFPDSLNRKRIRCRKEQPDDYDWIWNGQFRRAAKSAYYARQLTAAREDGRIGILARDPLMSVYAFWDIGGTGAKSDATAIWIVQFIGRMILLLNYYEVVGQPLSEHARWLKARGYADAHCVLPHDGGNHEKIEKVTYESALNDAGFSVTVVPNQGKGAATERIEALRRVFPQMMIDEKKCANGIEALAWYREKWDEKRQCGLGPMHDFSSHGADAAGLIAIYYLTIYALRSGANQKPSDALKRKRANWRVA